MVAVEISGNAAEARITEVVKRAEAGEEEAAARLRTAVEASVPVAPRPGAAGRRAVLDVVRAEGRATASPGPDGARSRDFLYDKEGLPR